MKYINSLRQSVAVKAANLMRLAFAVMVLLMTSFKIADAQKLKPIDIYIIGGQSNATGQGYMANLPDTFAIDKNVLLFHSGKPHMEGPLPPFQWGPLHQSSESPDKFGPELGFGNRLQQLYPGHTIGIIKHAHSGTSLFSDWNPGAGVNDTLHFGPQFKVFLQTIDSGLNSLKKLGYKPIVKGMIWQQGENDADAGGAYSAGYGKNLAHFIDRVRQQLKLHRLLFIYGYVYPPPKTGKESDEVRKGEHDADQDSGSAIARKRAFVIPTDDLSQRADDRNTPYPKDRIHFGTNGTLQLGIRMANKMYQELH